jgi:PHD/YefM family antitoxin component YafN of YafNO toxin-antitoxin module
MKLMKEIMNGEDNTLMVVNNGDDESIVVTIENEEIAIMMNGAEKIEEIERTVTLKIVEGEGRHKKQQL